MKVKSRLVKNINNYNKLFDKQKKIIILIILAIVILYNDIDKKFINEKEIKKYKDEQNDFCDNPSKYYKNYIEEQIELQNVSLLGLTYKMYIYKKKHFMSSIKKNGVYEKKETINILNALQYYSRIKNIFNNKEIFMIDIGGHTGWYPSFFGRLGYSILSFEPLEMNYYILRKNLCLMKKYSNIVIITKGINNYEMICDYYKHGNNMGNGMIICNKKNISKGINFQKISQVSLVKLSRYIPFLSKKNIALIKIDIEGNEGKAIESGFDLINKYRVPFILIEFTPIFLKEHGTDPNKFLKLFIKNGYKISIHGFLSNNYISIEDIFKITKYQINLYFIHSSIIK